MYEVGYRVDRNQATKRLVRKIYQRTNRNLAWVARLKLIVVWNITWQLILKPLLT